MVQANVEINTERDYEVICELSNGVIFSDLELP